MPPQDHYFDTLAVRFAEHIYGTAKGAIRLAALQADLAEILGPAPLRVLDIGAGMGQISLWLASQSHQVTLAEPSAPMLDAARAHFAEAGLSAEFLPLPWQQLAQQQLVPYDLVLCHAVLEWLAEPTAILPTLARLTARQGWLSLAFYNRDALVYRNLLKGHFKCLGRDRPSPGKGGLTPLTPLDPGQLRQLLEEHWCIEQQSGIRVFHDYMPLEFQRRTDQQQLIDMELHHRRHPTFAGLGRYLHWLCRPRTEHP